MEPSMMLEPVVSLIGDYKSTVFEDGPYPDRGDPKEHNQVGKHKVKICPKLRTCVTFFTLFQALQLCTHLSKMLRRVWLER